MNASGCLLVFFCAFLICCYNLFNVVCRERVTNTSTLEANVQHLKPATSYVFRVRAYNRYGAGTEMAEITVVTEAEGKDMEYSTHCMENSTYDIENSTHYMENSTYYKLRCILYVQR